MIRHDVYEAVFSAVHWGDYLATHPVIVMATNPNWSVL